MALMERESVNLEREFKLAEKTYGTDHLDLVLTNGYIGKLIDECEDRQVSSAACQRHPNRISEADGNRSRCRLTRAEIVCRDEQVLMGTRTRKRGDRGRSRTVGRIKRGGGDGGEPVRSPLGWSQTIGRAPGRNVEVAGRVGGGSELGAAIGPYLVSCDQASTV